jgi:hypothetical protein
LNLDAGDKGREGVVIEVVWMVAIVRLGTVSGEMSLKTYDDRLLDLRSGDTGD